MPLAPEYYTADMVRALPEDGNRYELVHGELLVTPAPRVVHQRLVLRLARQLAAHVERTGGFEVFVSPADISWGDDTLVQPDVFVVPAAEARTGDWSRMRSLTLVAEVVSPSTARTDRFAKRKLYQEQGIPTLWLVDPERRLVEVWTSDARFPVIETAAVHWTHTPGTDPLVLDLEALFAD